ncbi:hypothetical protein D3C85_764340 [compost metagenome]
MREAALPWRSTKREPRASSRPWSVRTRRGSPWAGLLTRISPRRSSISRCFASKRISTAESVFSCRRVPSARSRLRRSPVAVARSAVRRSQGVMSRVSQSAAPPTATPDSSFSAWRRCSPARALSSTRPAPGRALRPMPSSRSSCCTRCQASSWSALSPRQCWQAPCNPVSLLPRRRIIQWMAWRTTCSSGPAALLWVLIRRTAAGSTGRGRRPHSAPPSAGKCPCARRLPCGSSLRTGPAGRRYAPWA